jgi:hypothetical protein
MICLKKNFHREKKDIEKKGKCLKSKERLRDERKISQIKIIRICL